MERLTGRQVLDAGLPDWRKLAQALHARFETGSLAAGADFLAAMTGIERRPDQVVEARLVPAWIEVRVATCDDGVWVTAHDLDLARRISDLAASRGLRPDPSAVTQVELALDTAHARALGPFWAALLTGRAEHVVHGEVMDPDTRVPNLWFQAADAHGPPRQRFHLDVWVAPEVAAERIAAALAAGGTVVDDREAPSYVVLADSDGNRACLCTCSSR